MRISDALVCVRDGKSGGVQEKVLQTLLNEMDGIGVRKSSSSGKKSLAATDADDNSAMEKTTRVSHLWFLLQSIIGFDHRVNILVNHFHPVGGLPRGHPVGPRGHPAGPQQVS